MKIINILPWKEFKLEELFDIHPTKSYKYTNKDLLNIDGNNPVIGNSSYNNGIIGYSIFDNTEQGNIITFSDTTSSEAIFYQKKPFIGYSHIQGMYPREKYNNWNEYSYLYILTIIKKAVTLLGVDYVNKFTRDMANNIIIKLPIKEDNSLNYEYMVTYMKNLEAISINYLKNLQLLELNNYKKIDLRKWRRFNLYDKELFTIDSGNKLDKAKMTTINPTINFVGRSNQNNGITIEVDEIIGQNHIKKGI